MTSVFAGGWSHATLRRGDRVRVTQGTDTIYIVDRVRNKDFYAFSEDGLSGRWFNLDEVGEVI